MSEGVNVRVAQAGPSSPHLEEMAEVARVMANMGWAETAIRRDERMRLAALLEDNSRALSGFAATPEACVRMISYMLTLDT